jgi:hypothetical protein
MPRQLGGRIRHDLEPPQDCVLDQAMLEERRTPVADSRLDGCGRPCCLSRRTPWTISKSAACRSSCGCSCSCARRALDYDAAQFKRGSEMPKRPDVGVLAEQVIERLKQIEDQVTQNQRLADELGRLRDVVKDLERAIVSGFSGEQVPAAEPTERARRQSAAKRSRAAIRPSAAKRATAPRGQNQAKILDVLKGSEPMTASEIATLTGSSAGTVSTTLTKMVKTGELTKAERGYRLPG